MQRQCTLSFLTFVLIITSLMTTSALALPNNPSPDIEASPEAPSSLDPDDAKKRLTIDIGQPPPFSPALGQDEAEFFYPFRHALTFRIGQQYDTKASDKGKNVETLLGIQYLFSLEKLKSFEAGADLQSDGAGVLHVAQRTFYSRAKLRPYSKWGAGIRVVPDEKIATFLKYQNYQARAGAGFEYLIKSPSSVRAEVELAVSFRSLQANATLGYVWAW